ncbi:MAG: carboxypeptidase regulatory-like domain-containing protein [Acidobacteria bacterium]|nr:carboxypeptidase regulatory-like domain-containing protein [Acidobacteriota bacterium]
MTRLTLALVVSLSGAFAQSAPAPRLQGVITDPSGASVPGAVIELRGPGGTKRFQSDAAGKYASGDLVPGQYRIRITVKGFATVERNSLAITRQVTFDAQLAIQPGREIVQVGDETGRLTLDPLTNGGGVFFRERQVAQLSDDPDELILQLRALSGPAPGPNGGQFFVDGFTGVNLPPKSAIREVRINMNPFSPEYDRPGFSRIEIFTKPGSDSIRGQAFGQFNDSVLNSRNPLLAQSERPPYSVRSFGFDLSGPLKKNKSSFTLGLERRRINETGLILATTLDNNLNPLAISQAVSMPQTRTSVTPRLDYALTPKNTLAVRYQELRSNLENIGAGDFNLPSRGYDETSANRIVQVTETAVFSAKAVNETRFQFARASLSDSAREISPAINVQGAFSSGGATVNQSSSVTNSFELSNVSTLIAGTHTFKWGGRVRQANLTDTSRNNFSGSFTFLTLEDYRRTLAGEPGAGPWQFSRNTGTPSVEINQADFGFFLNDDWKARPGLTVSYGLRYEAQTNLGDLSNWAPRAGIAWGLDGRANRPARTVLRLGAGIFFDRVPVSVTLNAMRYDGSSQRSYVIFNPLFFPQVPSPEALAATGQPQQLRPVYSGLDAPRLYQTSISIERQWSRSTRITVNWIQSRGTQLLNVRNINTPVDRAYPFGDRSIRLLTESAGSSRLNQLVITPNMNYRKLSLSGFYSLSYGMDNNEALPADPYNLRAEWGPSSYGDVRHRVVAMSSVPLPGKISLMPFFTANSGLPFNITTGLDPSQTGFAAARPALLPGASCIQRSCFNLNPAPGTPIIGRNFGHGPASVNLGLRLSYTYTFGGRIEGGSSIAVPSGTHGGSGGPSPNMFAGNTGRRYNLTFTASSLNPLNRANYAPPNGNLSSPYYGQPRSLGGLIVMSHGGAQTSYNRKIDLQVRFTF